jgi:hypothetical protein
VFGRSLGEVQVVGALFETRAQRYPTSRTTTPKVDRSTTAMGSDADGVWDGVDAGDDVAVRNAGGGGGYTRLLSSASTSTTTLPSC